MAGEIPPKVCHYCHEVIVAATYEERFRLWGWHLRLRHFVDWGVRDSGGTS